MIAAFLDCLYCDSHRTKHFIYITSFNPYYILVGKVFLFSLEAWDAEAERNKQIDQDHSVISDSKVLTSHVGWLGPGILILKQIQSWANQHMLDTVMPAFLLLSCGSLPTCLKSHFITHQTHGRCWYFPFFLGFLIVDHQQAPWGWTQCLAVSL